MLHRLTRYFGNSTGAGRQLVATGQGLESKEGAQEEAPGTEGPAPEEGLWAPGQSPGLHARRLLSCWVACSSSLRGPEPENQGPRSRSQRICKGLLSNTFKMLSTEPDI